MRLEQDLFNYGVKPPAGVLVRTDREGGEWEVVAGGLRNPFGIAFNRQGDVFTFDADMEWDAGATLVSADADQPFGERW
ncbi:MAG: hypothetical protein U0894_18235 [Pirellulales bacterium]